MKHNDSKKPAIMEAALKLFAAKGIKATTTKEISRQARAAEGSLYRHFKSKEELASQLFAKNADALTQFLTERNLGKQAFAQRLAALLTALFEFAHHYPEAYSYVLSRHHTEFKKMPANGLKPKDVFVDLIRQGIEAGEFRAMDANLAAAMIIGMAIRANFFMEQGFVKLARSTVISEVVKSALRIIQR